MSYRIEIKPSAKKELAQLPREIGESVVKAIAALAENPRPHGYKKLTGSQQSYRIRVGNYRVVYSLFEQQLMIEIVKIGDRKDVYGNKKDRSKRFI
ncbi:plasmid stabilization system [Methylococcaceae bacterium]|nr:plasmid stabilization system [Methylococcaceae bacterium]